MATLQAQIAPLPAPRLRRRPEPAERVTVAPARRPVSCLQFDRMAITCPGPGAGLEETQSFLEGKKITDQSRKDYLRRLQEFFDLCAARFWNWLSDEQLGGVVIAVLDEYFWKGRSASDGEKLVAALKHFLARYRRLGAGSLPRATSALVAFAKLRPPLQRTPLPLVVLCAICGVLLRRGLLPVVLQLLLASTSYLRLSESDLLQVKCLVRPTPAAGPEYQLWGLLLHPSSEVQPSKVGLYDEAIMLDDEISLALLPFFEVLVTSRHPDDMLWPHDGAALSKEFMMACDELHLGCLSPCRYKLRHGGASEDIRANRRSLLAVKRRGRWSDDRSLKRYGKETLLLSELQKVDPAVLAFGRLVQDNLSHLLLQSLPLPAAPVLPCRVAKKKSKKSHT